MALGEEKTAAIYRELQRVQKALELKAGVAQNSRTAIRTSIQDDVRSQTDAGVMDAVKEGRPLEAPRRFWQQLTGATPDARSAQQEAIYNEIAKLLTGPRGPNATRALQSLIDAYNSSARNKAVARSVGNLATGGLLLPAYQAQDLLSK